MIGRMRDWALGRQGGLWVACLPVLTLAPEDAELLAALTEIGDGELDLDALGLSFPELPADPDVTPETEE